MIRICAIALYLIAGLQPAAHANGLSIEWEVENRFRFYANPDFFRAYASVAQGVARGPDWILQTERAMQSAYVNGQFDRLLGVRRVRDDEAFDTRKWNGWASLWRYETCLGIKQKWDVDGIDRSVCPDYILPKAHRVIARAQGDSSNAAQCHWSVGPAADAKAGAQIVIVTVGKDNAGKETRDEKNVASVSQPCKDPIKVSVPYSVDKPVPATLNLEVAGTKTSASVLVRDVLVLGMGDSFGAGVGNPDLPMQVEWRHGVSYQDGIGLNRSTKLVPGRIGARILGQEQAQPSEMTKTLSQGQAQWMDIRCFRSQYGPQLRTALHLAVDFRHTAVTYIDLACDGARIVEGLLHQKSIGPGHRAGQTLPQSQIGVASTLLCGTGEKTPARYTLRRDCLTAGDNEICEYKSPLFQANKELKPAGAKTSMDVCESGKFVRPIDIVLLSIGGNDIGFAPMVADVIVDDQGLHNELLRKFAERLAGALHSGTIGEERLRLLLDKYRKLDAALVHLPLRKTEGSASKPVFLAAYPLPIDDADGRVCGTNANATAAGNAMDVSRMFSRFEERTADRPKNKSPHERLLSVLRTSCLLNLKRLGWFSDGSDRKAIIAELTGKNNLCSVDVLKDLKIEASDLEDEKNKIPWHFVADFMSRFRGHGFCATSAKPQDRDGVDDLQIPAFKGPSDWSPTLETFAPYRPRQRWARTPNDALVVTNWHVQKYAQKDYMNLTYASATSSMHPTAEGYAAIADGLLAHVAKRLCNTPDVKDEPICKNPR